MKSAIPTTHGLFGLGIDLVLPYHTSFVLIHCNVLMLRHVYQSVK